MSAKHPYRYVTEFAGRLNDCPLDTRDQMSAMVRGMDGRRGPDTISEPNHSEPW